MNNRQRKIKEIPSKISSFYILGNSRRRYFNNTKQFFTKYYAYKYKSPSKRYRILKRRLQIPVDASLQI